MAERIKLDRVVTDDEINEILLRIKERARGTSSPDRGGVHPMSPSVGNCVYNGREVRLVLTGEGYTLYHPVWETVCITGERYV